jgi:hypothetical protein
MFLLTSVRRELWHRKLQALFVASGLAVGIGLVVTVTPRRRRCTAHPLRSPARPLRRRHRLHPPPPGTSKTGGFERHFDVLRPGPIGLLRDSAVAKVRQPKAAQPKGFLRPAGRVGRRNRAATTGFVQRAQTPRSAS